MSKLRTITIEEEVFYYSLSFDINDFIGDGIWWLQIYDHDKEMLYDKPFASSRGNLEPYRIVETIKHEVCDL